MTLPLNLPSQDMDETSAASTLTPRKSETRRSSLAANQNKLTRIVEESEHEASSNSSKEIRHNVEPEEDSSDDNDDEDDDDFDSECSVVSDLDSKTDQLVSNFRTQTRTFISNIELTFLDLDAVSEPLLEIVANVQNLKLNHDEDSRPERNDSDLKKMAIECEIKKLSSIQESKETSVAETEQILSQVQLELAEVKKSIMVRSEMTVYWCFTYCKSPIYWWCLLNQFYCPAFRPAH